MTIGYTQSNARRKGAILWILGLCFLLFLNPNSANASECTPEEVKEYAQSRFGGNAIDVWRDENYGNYFVVQLEYSDGTLFEFGVHRWACPISWVDTSEKIRSTSRSTPPPRPPPLPNPPISEKIQSTCTKKEIKEYAQSRFGGNAIDVWWDENNVDYFVVQLEYSDGTLFEFGVHRWACPISWR